MTPNLSPKLPGRAAAKILTLCFAAASAAAFVLAAAPDAAVAAPADAATGTSATQLDWARAALARNGALEVVSTDSDEGTITVRVKSTGELRKVRADEVIAAPPTDLGSRRSRRAVGLDSSAAAPPGSHVIASGPGTASRP